MCYEYFMTTKHKEHRISVMDAMLLELIQNNVACSKYSFLHSGIAWSPSPSLANQCLHQYVSVHLT